MYKEIQKYVQDMQAELVSCRRDFHKYAETGWMEMRTSSLVARELARLGYEVLTGREVCRDEARMGLPSEEILEEHYQWAKNHGADEAFLEQTKGGFTGVIGILHCGEGPVTVLRFDLDALGVFEEKKESHRPVREGFASVTEGAMHACGHDGHTAIGLGTARILAKIRDSLSGTVKLIFQPAEEGVRGAKSIVEQGHLDGVDYVLGTHLTNSPDGICRICPGMAGTFATTKLDAYFRGKSAHAGMCPENGENAMLAAAAAVLNLHGIPRHSGGNSRINVGTFHAGSGRNVVCDRAKLELEVRGETTEVNSYMESYAVNVLNASAAMHGCTVEIKEVGSAAAIACTEALTQRIYKICKEKLGMEVGIPDDLGGSEDFAYMTQRVIEQGGQACFTGIQIPCAAPFHSESFDFDERALVLGVQYYSGIVWALLGNGEE